MIFNYIYKSYSVTKIVHKSIMNRNKLYLRFNPQEDKIDINFLYRIKDETWRQFNFSRKSTDTIENLNMRIAVNVQKILQKKNKTGKDAQIFVNVRFLNSDLMEVPPTEISVNLFNYNFPIHLCINDVKLEAIFNPPWILSVNLPKTLLANFPVYLENFTTQYATKDNCYIEWFKSTGNLSNSKWEYIGFGMHYVPKLTDIGNYIKAVCVPGNPTSTGPSVEVISKNVVEAGPGVCPFETRHQFTSNKLSGDSFRCISYNILADLYCDSEYSRTVLFPYCPAYALEIDYRKQLIIREINGYNADVICLQEVDGKIFDLYLSPLLNEQGYSGVFHKKGKQVAEGLAYFYRNNRFKKISDEQILLSEVISKYECFSHIWNAIKENESLLKRLLDRSTIAGVTILQSIENLKKILIVGNTHLYFHPDADHIRLLQGAMYVQWIAEVIKDTCSNMVNVDVSTIMCGDFNSVPTCGIYKLYTTGTVPDSIEDWRSNVSEAVSNLSLSNNIKLASACGTPVYTNFTSEFADCLDYIFYDTEKLVVEQVVPFPSQEELQANTAIPSVVFPSDHISLVADLRFK